MIAHSFNIVFWHLNSIKLVNARSWSSESQEVLLLLYLYTDQMYGYEKCDKELDATLRLGYIMYERHR